MAERDVEEWLIRYLIVGFMALTASLAFVYAVVRIDSMPIAVASIVVLLAVSAVVALDLHRWRAA